MTSTNQPASVPVMKRVLRWSLVLTAAIAVVGGIVGWFVAGWAGVWSAVVAALLAMLFTGVTVVSVILAARFDAVMFMGIILGAWILKLLVFLGVLAIVKQLDFTHDWMLWSCMVVAIIGHLTIDLLVVASSRLGAMSDIKLPGE
ncbi:hypothetical protein [Gulosibacter hominis]|uniref:hypothetical protein n=1 Tax=Gulosibacter hominis TaxID=2770504 RepID=UPI001917F76B|nr:hypothetical protein [Gulosibacter hominis]